MNDADNRVMMMYDVEKKSMVLAYLLWFFLGSFGAHRFYMGRIFSAIVMCVIFVISWILTVILIGFVGIVIIFVWWVVDGFLIYQWVKKFNLKLVYQLDQ